MRNAIRTGGQHGRISGRAIFGSKQPILKLNFQANLDSECQLYVVLLIF